MLAILAIVLIMSTPLSAEVVYLTSIQGWSYFKVRVSGPMTGTNIKAACVAEGMMYPCMRANLDCYNTQWTDDCPVLPDEGVESGCRVQVHISNDMCGTTEPRQCPPLDDTFIYIPGYYQSGDGCGIDADTNRWCVEGAQVSDLYATCVIRGGTDACASNPCQNGATCMAGQNQYTCSCTFGWTGDHCSERHIFHNDEKCYQLSSDALNHANAETKCTTLGGSLAAIKDREEQTFLANQISQGSDVSYWIGLKSAPNTFIFSDFSQLGSSVEWVPGEPDNLCVLLDKDGGYKCKTDLCHASHNYVCQSDITSCGQRVCQNGGNCTSCFNDEKVFCDCAPGFTGEKCEINVNECDSSPCQFGGTCVDGVDSYTCICVPGYRGDDCEIDIDLCNPNVCPFGWTCVDAGISMHCYAFGQGRTGDQYKCMESSCPTGMMCAEAGPDSYSCIYG